MTDFKHNGEKTVRVSCPDCYGPETTLHHYIKFFDILKIPFFIDEKLYVLFCNRCQKELPAEKIALLTKDQKKFPLPWYTYSGLILALLGGLVWVFFYFQGVKDVDTFKNNPVSGVRFVYKTDEPEVPYTYGKVESVSETTLTICLGSYMVSKKDMANDKAQSDQEKYWSESTVEVSKDTFKTYDITRIFRVYDKKTAAT